MKLSLLTASLLLTGSLYASGGHTSSTTEGINAIKLLGKTLKGHLQEKMKLDANGTAAMAFCTSEAQTLTHQINEQLPSHVKVRRTSLKLRNAANQADETDIMVMKKYEEAFKKKQSSAGVMTTVTVDGTKRIYKPLVMGEACLKCHGETLSEPIQASLADSYPDDQATGMKLGDFRGVIVAEVSAH